MAPLQVQYVIYKHLIFGPTTFGSVFVNRILHLQGCNEYHIVNEKCNILISLYIYGIREWNIKGTDKTIQMLANCMRGLQCTIGFIASAFSRTKSMEARTQCDIRFITTVTNQACKCFNFYIQHTFSFVFPYSQSWLWVWVAQNNDIHDCMLANIHVTNYKRKVYGIQMGMCLRGTHLALETNRFRAGDQRIYM